MTNWKLVVLLGTVIAFDQMSKIWAMGHFHIAPNTGVSFGLAPIWGLMLHGLGLLVVGLVMFFSRSKYRGALLLVLAGGFSNMIDRWRWGGVVDWLIVPGTGLQNNVADYVIAVGVLWLLTVTLLDI